MNYTKCEICGARGVGGVEIAARQTYDGEKKLCEDCWENWRRLYPSVSPGRTDPKPENDNA